MAKPWRPSIDDVDSISRGGPAKVRGTGSRNIPHRLNAEERGLYDLAKKKGFLAVRGTGYRKFRHGNPLPNIFRQWCDARGQLCVVVEQGMCGEGSGSDRLVVDLAPLRLEDTREVEAELLRLASEMGVRRVGYDERPEDALPFNILPPDDDGDGRRRRLFDTGSDDEDEGEEELIVMPVAGLRGGASQSAGGARVTDGGDSDGDGDGGVPSTSGAVAVNAAEVEALRGAVAAQAAVVRRLKEEEGRGNGDEAVQAEVQVLLRLKADLQRATDAQQRSQPRSPSGAGKAHDSVAAAAASSDGAGKATGQELAEARTAAGSERAQAQGNADCQAPRRSPVSHYYSLPIWQIHAVPLFFEAERPLAKQFAGAAVKCVAECLSVRR